MPLRGLARVERGQAIGRVFADCLEQAIAHATAVLLRSHERRVGERFDEVERSVLVACEADCGCGGDREAADEDRKPGEEGALIGCQEVVAPVERLTQRLLPGG